MFFTFNPILVMAAVVPAVFLLVKVYRADRLEPEPLPLLISLVLFGIIATALAVGAEYLGELLLNTLCPDNPLLYYLLMYFIVVGGAEEGAKYAILYRRTWRSEAFNCQFDGVVYATFISLGFALWENIRYVLSYGLSTALIRAATAVPGHACFGVFMGAFYGMAKRFEGRNRTGACTACKILSFLVPMLLHGAYDFIASMESTPMGWVFFAFIAALFAASFFIVRKLSEGDRYIE